MQNNIQELVKNKKFSCFFSIFISLFFSCLLIIHLREFGEPMRFMDKIEITISVLSIIISTANVIHLLSEFFLSVFRRKK